ncbi:MAG TPA: hypothetical protein DEQ80_10760 [Anaerolinea thermolimosa]|uniref:Glycosyltransferase RgtA/B/C/D-like domain-containing protein n=1 Tax=Anaerolinea thermolimosa TaxID=229919 RepID=A0A3D1JIC6_9CHLR|nr:hypothetical protein [Anaerolinea thermolimosa]
MSKRLANALFALILLAYLVYGVVFLLKMVVTINGQVYFLLFDDATISMTYARNLAQGYGLVWNPGGERVEGFTNLLWVLYMALFHRLPIPESWMALPIQITGLVLMLANLFVVRKMALRLAPNHPVVMILGVLLTAFYYPLTNWSLIGTEVGAMLLGVSVSVWLALDTLEDGRFRPGLYLWMGLLTLVRPDAVVGYLAVWGFLVLFDARNRRAHGVWGGGMLVLFAGGQTLWRHWYYGEWVPNTYILKMEGLPAWARIRRGAIAFYHFVRGFFWPLMVFPLSLVFFRRDRRVLLLGLVFLAHGVYSIYVGGDAWEHRGGANRFIAPAMPEFFLLFALTSWHWVDWALKQLEKRLSGGRGAIRVLAGTGLAGFVVFSVLMMNRLVDNGSVISNLRNPAEGALRFFLLYERSIYVPGSLRYARDGLLIREVTRPEARVAMVTAGNICYFVHRTCIDLLGKSDRVVARSPIQVSPEDDWEVLRPGHIKFNYAYSIGKLRPDVVVELLVSTYDVGEKYLTDYEKVRLNGHWVYFRKDSSAINWEKLYAIREDQ